MFVKSQNYCIKGNQKLQFHVSWVYFVDFRLKFAHQKLGLKLKKSKPIQKKSNIFRIDGIKDLGEFTGLRFNQNQGFCIWHLLMDGQNPLLSFYSGIIWVDSSRTYPKPSDQTLYLTNILLLH